jgi:hypothetical protein
MLVSTESKHMKKNLFSDPPCVVRTHASEKRQRNNQPEKGMALREKGFANGGGTA